MKKVFGVAIIVALVMAMSLTAAAAGPGKIGVVDVNMVIRESQAGLQSDYQAQAANAQNKIQQRTQDLRNQILQEIGGVLQNIGDRDNYQIIHDVSSVFYYKKVVDITWQVIREYDDYVDQQKQAQ